MRSNNRRWDLRVLQPNNKGQVTLFIIIAVVIVVAVIAFFVVRGVLDSGGIGRSSDEVFAFF